MKTIKYIYLIIGFIIVGAGFFLNSCSVNGFQDDPNYPSEGMPSLLLPRLIERTFYDGNQVGAGAACQLLFYTERAESDQYWGWSTTSMGAYENIKQAVLMEEEALKSQHAAYAAIARLIKQIQYYQLTRDVGDIPYSDALKASENNFSPKYDTQKAIFQSIFLELEDINQILSENLNAAISGDILYNGDIDKWRKLTNSYRLKMLMDLSLKANDGEMNIIVDFRKIISNPATYPIFESNQDMPRFKFYDLDGNRAPTFDRTTTRVQTKLTSTLVDYMRETTDFRLFAFAEPAWPEGATLWTDDQRAEFRVDFANYAGLDPGGVFGDEAQKASSNIHWRYHEDPTVEDYCKFTYADLNFIIAEACMRGWITGDASVYYKRGVEASMSFYSVRNEDVQTYWQNPNAEFVGQSNVNMAIEQINMQRWVAYFMNSNWEGYYNNRRTRMHKLGPAQNGVPEFKISQTHYVEQMPMRWLYPQSEYNTNRDNVTEAVQRQFGKAEETQFDLIWMLQE